MAAFVSVSEIDTVHFAELLENVRESLDYFGAELTVAIAALAIFIIDLFLPPKASKHLAWVAILACIVPAVSLWGATYPEGDSRLFLGMVSFDSFANFYKLFFLLGSIPVILLSYLSKQLQDRPMGEYYGILLASVFGAILLASSTHFLMLFMSLELLSICSYVLVGYRRKDNKGVEAALKYIIYGSVAAAVMLFGMSLFYGLTGSADLASLANIVRQDVLSDRTLQGHVAITALFSLLLIFVGIAYKMSTIPMHFWAPDAYEGAPTPITAFLSVVSKAAGFALALRFFQSLTDAVGELPAADPSQAVWGIAGVPNAADTGISPWIALLILLSILTMTLGNLGALWQTNLKRLFAYSSIAHAGYLMMGLTILEGSEVGGISAISFYLLAYLAMNFGVFAVIIIIENRTGSVELEEYEGLGRRSPFLAAALVVFLFSLIGIPPTAGFAGKWQLFMGVLDMGRPEYYVLAVAAALNTGVSAYYYMKIVREMYLRDSRKSTEVPCSLLGKALVVSMVFMTLYLFFGARYIDLDLRL